MAEGGPAEEIIIDGNKSRKENIERNKPKLVPESKPDRVVPSQIFTVDQIPNAKDSIKPALTAMAEGGGVELEQDDQGDALAYLHELLGNHAQA